MIVLLILNLVVLIIAGRILLYKSTILKERAWYIPLYIILFFVAVGILFKIQHLNGANFILLISLLSLSGFSLLRMLIKPHKTFLSYLKYACAIIFPIGELFKLQHWQGGVLMIYIAFILFILTILINIYQDYFKKTINSKNDTLSP